MIITMNSNLSEELKQIITNKTNVEVIDEKNNRRHPRCKVIQEILTSELTYLQNLETLMKYFLQPIHEMEYIDHVLFTNLCRNIQMLYDVGGALLEELKNDSNNVAKAFNRLAPFFKLYSVYAYDYQRITMLLQEMQEKNMNLKNFIRNQETRPEVNTKLPALLITPIQRIPRYKLLIKEVLQHTDDQHKDYTLLKVCLVAIERVVSHIDSMLAETENNHELLRLQKCIKNAINLIEPGRHLIKAGPLMKVSRRRNAVFKRYFILLSDNLLYCEGDPEHSLTLCGIMPLKKCYVERIFSGGMFRVTCLQVTLLLYSEQNDSDEWIESLKKAIQRYTYCRSTLKKESSSRIPLIHRNFHLWQSKELPKVTKKRKRDRSWKMMYFDQHDDCLFVNKRCKKTKQEENTLQSIYEFYNKIRTSVVNFFTFR